MGREIEAQSLRVRLTEMGYNCVSLLPVTKEWAGVMPMLYTTGLFVGLNEWGYRLRYCYEKYGDARAALFEWDGSGDPPGPWIKAKGDKGGDRNGPGAKGEAVDERKG